MKLYTTNPRNNIAVVTWVLSYNGVLYGIFSLSY